MAINDRKDNAKLIMPLHIYIAHPY